VQGARGDANYCYYYLFNYYYRYKYYSTGEKNGHTYTPHAAQIRR
jgi:hypothetical protein